MGLSRISSITVFSSRVELEALNGADELTEPHRREEDAELITTLIPHRESSAPCETVGSVRYLRSVSARGLRRERRVAMR
jgi:hypothetical protein